MNEPEYERLVQRGIAVRKRQDGTQWELGDLALQVETKYGEHSLQWYAEEVGVEYRSLTIYRQVATAYEKYTRVYSLNWTHHLEVYTRDHHLE